MGFDQEKLREKLTKAVGDRADRIVAKVQQAHQEGKRGDELKKAFDDALVVEGITASADTDEVGLMTRSEGI
jgi:hypothetical protein